MYLVIIRHLGEYLVYTKRFADNMAETYRAQGYLVSVRPVYSWQLEQAQS
jgi:hypothetical protein